MEVLEGELREGFWERSIVGIENLGVGGKLAGEKIICCDLSNQQTMR